MPDQVRHDGLTDFMDRHYLILENRRLPSRMGKERQEAEKLNT